MSEIQVLEETLGSLEAESRRLDSTPDEIQRWLDALSRFSAEYLEANATSPAFLPLGARSPAVPLPLEPSPFNDVLDEFQRVALTRGIVATSGRFFGYVPGGGIPTGAVGDYLAALTNRYSGNYGAAPGAAAIENDTVRWLIEMVGYPETAWGTLQSGGSLATLTAVVAARESRQAWDWMRSVIYMTEECHLAIRKSLHIAGLAHVPCRTVPVDERLHMSVPDLERMIAEDRSKSLQPWMVFASAGTVNTGAIDPLAEIARVARDEGLWMHVDGAYGAFFVLAERARASLEAMALADSVVLDPHKGLFLPYGSGAVLVKDGDVLRQAFAATHSYLSDVEHEEPSPSSYSPELTRHFRGLRLWAEPQGARPRAIPGRFGGKARPGAARVGATPGDAADRRRAGARALVCRVPGERGWGRGDAPDAGSHPRAGPRPHELDYARRKALRAAVRALFPLAQERPG
jgi:hypothetical protein